MSGNTHTGYCVKCKQKRDFVGTPFQAKNGSNMVKGPCEVCGTTVNRILPKPKV